MKKIFFSIVAMLPVVVMCQNINVLYSFRTYHATNMDYAEINTTIDGSSLQTIKTESGKYIKQAELTTFISNIHQKDSAIYVDKRIITTPQTKDTNELTNISLMDMQRIRLDNDTFLVMFKIKDINANNQPLMYNDIMIMSYPENEINLADIMLVDNYTKTSKENVYSKRGYDMYPYMFDAIGKENNILTYYTEIYNTDKTFGKDQPYIISTVVENVSTNTKVDGIQRIKREKATEITPYFSTIDITDLQEGSYYLTVEVRDAENMLHAYKRYPFFKHSDNKIQQSNVDIPQDAFVNNIADSELKETIRSLRPIASTTQTQYILKDLKNSTAEQDRYFIYQFFATLDPIDPANTYKQYAKNVDYVNEKYATHIKKGYATDMGRVYLAYGEPDEIIDEKFASSVGTNNVDKFAQRMNPDLNSSDSKGVTYYPYQIWVYNHTPMGESNRKFVFYARQDNMAEYFLLHSNAKGETQDIYWENTLSHGALEYGIVGKAGKQYERGHK